MFADPYFKRYIAYQPLTDLEISPNMGILVMIPAFREPDLLSTLRSLHQCIPAKKLTEVLVVINQPEICDTTSQNMNLTSYEEALHWITKNPHPDIRFMVTPPINLPQKWAGVGLARKKGMDEALWRFNKINQPRGIIVSLDADTLVEPNYLKEIEHHFDMHPDHIGATIEFSHQLDGLSQKEREGILLYEAYLRYYKNALAYTGYPNAIHTIGSAFAVSAKGYLQRGGMTRRKAGEDFYFLQHLTQIGTVGEITNTKVKPSSRVSDRVPFGTGPAMRQWMDGTTDLNYTYNIRAFIDLKQLFDRRLLFYKIDQPRWERLLAELPETVAAFLQSDLFFEQIVELSENCSTETIFGERFFQLFNAFRILKYIHFVHSGYFERRPIIGESKALQMLIGN